MPYSISLVEATTGSLNLEKNGGGFPGSFSQFTMSFWCVAGDGVSIDVPGFETPLVVGASPTISGGSQWFANGFSSATGVGSPIFEAGAGNIGCIPDNYLTNVLVSINTSTQTIQVYVNDVAIDVSGTTWSSSLAINNTAGHTWAVENKTLNGGFGDIWFHDTFIDFSVTANRRLFINSDFTPVDLGSTGQNPTGSTPLAYFHCNGATASSILTNLGSAGAWSSIGSPTLAIVSPSTYVTSGPLGTPTNLHVLGTTSTSIVVQWLPPGSGNDGTDYVLSYSSDGGITWTSITGITLTEWDIPGLTPNTTYQIQVAFENECGPGDGSNIVTQATMPAGAPIVITTDQGPIPLFPVLPEGFPVKFNPVMDTIVGTVKSLREIRYPQQILPLWDLEILFEELVDQTQNQVPYSEFTNFQQYMWLVETFLSLYAQTGVFAFDCPWDDSRSNQEIGVGDGSTTTFTIYRTWGTGALATLQSIGVVNTITSVTVGGSPVSSSDYTTVRNKITFTTAPALGAAIVMTFSFYYLCRFLEDEQDFEEFSKNRWRVPSLKFRAVNWP